MSRKYCKVKTANDYPVSVAQVRQLRRNTDWALDARGADVGTWGRLATDPDAAITGTVITRVLSPVVVDLTHYDTLYAGVVVNGTGTATWSVVISMSGGGTADITLSLTNPGTGASVVGSCVSGNGVSRTCNPQVIVTRLTGTGSLYMRYIGLWGHHSVSHEYGPQLLQSALAADLRIAYVRAKYALERRAPVIGWFGAYTFGTGVTKACRWYALSDKLDEDNTINSGMTADGIVYEVVSSAGKTWTVQHVQNNAAADSTTLNTAGTNILTPFSLPITAPSYKTSTPWSGGHLNVSCNADGNRPALRCMMLSRTAHAALWDAIKGTAPVQDLQIRTAAATGAIGVNDLAQTVHKCSWYQGGNVSGGMSQAGVAHALTSAGYTKAFDGLIWVHNDAQSGSTWGTNVYQVAVRCSTSGATNVTLRLTVDGQTATATKAAASGENYLLFEPSVASIDITKYAVACAAELTVDTSRTITVYSIQISRRGAAY